MTTWHNDKLTHWKNREISAGFSPNKSLGFSLFLREAKFENKITGESVPTRNIYIPT